jgi:hypothetical protein
MARLARYKSGYVCTMVGSVLSYANTMITNKYTIPMKVRRRKQIVGIVNKPRENFEIY